MLNVCVLMGRLTHSPELKTLKESGKNVLKFNLAINRPKRKDTDEQRTDFVDCVAWEKTAEFINRYFKKGDAIIVKGQLETRMYQDKQGNNRKATELLVREVDFCAFAKDNSQSDSKQVNQNNLSKNELYNDDLPF